MVRMNGKKNERGFIGSIGDDLPSIIPIVIALLLFFSIFASTLTTFNARNQVFSQNIETLSVAREMKGNSMILNTDHFQENCSMAKIRPRPYSFAVAIYPANHPVTEIAAYENDIGRLVGLNMEDYMEGKGDSTDTDDPDNGEYFCQYLRIGDDEFTGKERNFIVRYYPVAVQTKDDEGRIITVAAIMAMVIW